MAKVKTPWSYEEGYGGYAPGDWTPGTIVPFQAPTMAPGDDPPNGPYEDPTSQSTTPVPTIKYGTKLLEGDPSKLGNKDHIAGSPKYQFLSTVQGDNYGYGDLDGILASLQSQYGDFWKDWKVNGDAFEYGGDPANLHEAWGGKTWYDVVRGSKAGGEGWQWFNDDGQPQGGGAPMTFGGGGGVGGGGSYGGGGGGGSFGAPGGGSFAELQGVLKGLFPDGLFNKDIVNRRVSNVNDTLNNQRTSRLDSNAARLASRGLIGDGAEVTATNNLEEDLFNQQSMAVNDIYADEGRAADQRMMQALQISAGLTEAEAALAVEQFRAQTERSLGEGQLGLGWGRLGLDRELGHGRLALDNILGVGNLNLNNARFGLDRDAFLYGQNNDQMGHYIRLLELLMRGGDITAGGYY